MSVASAAPPRVLVIDDDPDIRDALRLLLEDAGYDIADAASRADALAQIDTTTFRCILTDAFAGTPAGALESIRPLVERARPTPLGLLTGWRLPQEDIERSGVAFVATKPFDLDQLLASVAAAIAMPLTPEQQRQAAVVRAYFAALTARDWDALVALCTDDVTYVLPGDTPFSGTVTGKAAFRAYTEDTYQHFPAARFWDVTVYATPAGLAARFQGAWRAPDGSEPRMSGAVQFQFTGERIKQIGVRLNNERLRALLAP